MKDYRSTLTELFKHWNLGDCKYSVYCHILHQSRLLEANPQSWYELRSAYCWCCQMLSSSGSHHTSRDGQYAASRDIRRCLLMDAHPMQSLKSDDLSAADTKPIPRGDLLARQVRSAVQSEQHLGLSHRCDEFACYAGSPTPRSEQQVGSDVRQGHDALQSPRFRVDHDQPSHSCRQVKSSTSEGLVQGVVLVNGCMNTKWGNWGGLFTAVRRRTWNLLGQALVKSSTGFQGI